MKTLHLHIGTPKTATTSIQQVLYNHQNILKRNHFSLLTTDYDNVDRKDGNAWWRMGTNNNLKGFLKHNIASLDKLAYDLSVLAHENIIASSEMFSEDFDYNRIEQLKYALDKVFIKINIYIYLRRQDLFTVSANQTTSSLGIANQGVRALSYPQFYGHILNYDALVSNWVNVFNRENVYIGVFEKEQLFEQDITKDFFSKIGLKKEIKNLKLVHKNISRGFESSKVAAILAQSNLNINLKKFILQEMSNEGKMLPSRHEAQNYYDNFISSNIELNKKFKISSKYEDIFNHDFNMYPEEAHDVWTEEKANQAILNIFHSIEKLIIHK